MSFIDLTGVVFDDGAEVLHRLKVNNKKKHAFWTVKCSCGWRFSREGWKLNQGDTMCRLCKEIYGIDDTKPRSKVNLGRCLHPGCKKQAIPNSKTAQFEKACYSHYINDQYVPQGNVMSSLSGSY